MSKGLAIAAIVLISLFSLGSLRSTAVMGFSHPVAHAADEAMVVEGACAIATNCVAAQGGTHDAECASRCLSAAASARTTMPTLPSLFAGALFLILAISELVSFRFGAIRHGTDAVGRLLLRQRLATVVLRN